MVHLHYLGYPVNATLLVLEYYIVAWYIVLQICKNIVGSLFGWSNILMYLYSMYFSYLTPSSRSDFVIFDSLYFSSNRFTYVFGYIVDSWLYVLGFNIDYMLIDMIKINCNFSAVTTRIWCRNEIFSIKIILIFVMRFQGLRLCVL